MFISQIGNLPSILPSHIPISLHSRAWRRAERTCVIVALGLSDDIVWIKRHPLFKTGESVPLTNLFNLHFLSGEFLSEFSSDKKKTFTGRPGHLIDCGAPFSFLLPHSLYLILVNLSTNRWREGWYVRTWALWAVSGGFKSPRFYILYYIILILLFFKLYT